MSEMNERCECARHGVRDATYVCQHLASGEGSGFNYAYAEDDPDGLWPDAWCDACERVLEVEGEWNDRSEAVARIRLVCDGCYQTVRAQAWTQDDEAFSRLLKDAVAYLQERQDDLSARYDLDRFGRYDWNQETGQLVFSDRGQARVVADIQFVGTLSTRTHAWLWSWANRSILESVKDGAREVRAYGEERQYLKLAAACWAAGEPDAWEMTAITAYLLRAAGAYRSPADGTVSFLAITGVHWVQ